MIYASFCFNFPQNVLGSRGSAPDPAAGLTVPPRPSIEGRDLVGSSEEKG